MPAAYNCSLRNIAKLGYHCQIVVVDLNCQFLTFESGNSLIHTLKTKDIY